MTEPLRDSKGEIMRYQNGEPIPADWFDNEPMTPKELGMPEVSPRVLRIVEKIKAGEPWSWEDL